jgi:hypothetical protein
VGTVSQRRSPETPRGPGIGSLWVLSPVVWFTAIHDAEYPSEYTASDLAFLCRLRRAATDWPYDPAVSWAWHVFGDPELVAAVTLTDRDSRVSLGDFGVHVLAPGNVRGDRLHNQTYALPDSPTNLAVEATGTPEQVVAHCAGWFGNILGKPVDRYEWWYRGEIYARRWLFADTGQGLVQSHLARRRGRPERLGAPDQIIRVRN